MRRFVIPLMAAAVLSTGGAASALSPAAQRGFVFVNTNCATCHAVGRFGDSPLAIAPPFRTLHERYPVESLAEALAEGIVVGHPTMPQFTLDPAQIDDVITYLKTLEEPVP
jgi:mono/diheme cytochrome c family protein